MASNLQYILFNLYQMVISYCAIICWFVCCTMYSYKNLEVLGIWPEGRVCWKHHKPFQLCYSTHLSSFDWVGLAVMPSRRSTKQFCKLAAQAPNFSLKLCANADNSAKTGLFFYNELCSVRTILQAKPC